MERNWRKRNYNTLFKFIFAIENKGGKDILRRGYNKVYSFVWEPTGEKKIKKETIKIKYIDDDSCQLLL